MLKFEFWSIAIIWLPIPQCLINNRYLTAGKKAVSCSSVCSKSGCKRHATQKVFQKPPKAGEIDFKPAEHGWGAVSLRTIDPDSRTIYLLQMPQEYCTKMIAGVATKFFAMSKSGADVPHHMLENGKHPHFDSLLLPVTISKNIDTGGFIFYLDNGKNIRHEITSSSADLNSVVVFQKTLEGSERVILDQIQRDISRTPMDFENNFALYIAHALTHFSLHVGEYGQGFNAVAAKSLHRPNMTMDQKAVSIPSFLAHVLNPQVRIMINPSHSETLVFQLKSYAEQLMESRGITFEHDAYGYFSGVVMHQSCTVFSGLHHNAWFEFLEEFSLSTNQMTLLQHLVEQSLDEFMKLDSKDYSSQGKQVDLLTVAWKSALTIVSVCCSHSNLIKIEFKIYIIFILV